MAHFIECKSRTMARRHYPSAARIIRVCGGYMAFDYLTDYYTWRNQK